MENILSIENMSKHFRGKQVLQGISFSLHSGEIVGLLGANGAGKSTCMKVIAGLYKATEGKVSLLHHEPFTEWGHLYNQVGILLEPSIPLHVTGIEFLKQIACLKNDHTTDLQALLVTCGLAQAGGKKVKHYSFGMKQRLGLAAALIGNPRFLMLDEPFVGLDPIGIRDLQQLLQQLATQGITILLSSHQLAEIETITERILFLHDGKVLHDIPNGPNVNLKALFEENEVAQCVK
ncbi:ATP-binding cassette domain-containing protein [Lysinibacillus sp. KU-BSD001]|uniref:ABC transporter ATP-binding protein n=1 Tax=Lysinibacillus sp. KU-BSD001 TaxID=3141328 RepID=UPI0036E7EC6D